VEETVTTARTYWAFLIVDSRGAMRLTKRQPRLCENEFAYRINVVIPASWWRTVVGTITLDLPERGGEPSVLIEEMGE
jgi:hypothetical protein